MNVSQQTATTATLSYSELPHTAHASFGKPESTEDLECKDKMLSRMSAMLKEQKHTSLHEHRRRITCQLPQHAQEPPMLKYADLMSLMNIVCSREGLALREQSPELGCMLFALCADALPFSRRVQEEKQDSSRRPLERLRRKYFDADMLLLCSSLYAYDLATLLLTALSAARRLCKELLKNQHVLDRNTAFHSVQVTLDAVNSAVEALTISIAVVPGDVTLDNLRSYSYQTRHHATLQTTLAITCLEAVRAHFKRTGLLDLIAK